MVDSREVSSTIQLFKAFLKENNALEEFELMIKEPDVDSHIKGRAIKEESMYKYYKTYLISFAFSWYKSEKGEDFWLDLSKKWEKVIKNKPNTKYKPIW